MWAVLALVTVDVASVAVKGLTDGQHVDGTLALDASAVDNQSGGIAELSLFVDDVKTANACSPKLGFGWDTSKLTSGKHVVDVVALNAKGKQSRRRFEVFAGDVFLTEVGAVFDEASQRARITTRNIADPKLGGAVAVEVWSVDEKKETPKARVFSAEAGRESGATELAWDGRDDKKNALPRGRYLAKLQFKDKTGAVRQTETALFLFDSDRVQRETYGEVDGSLKLGKLGIGSANTRVELVDDDGTVVQAVTSTEQGNYRFKNVKPGKYKVRTQKEGYQPLEAPVAAEAAQPASKADLTW
ncbi:MAG: carboxypeptidase regulatory-like domain-containing protein [Myxococcota bacterium]|jgi:squalene-hopene/tetraprenyl-beta-curcumene cyclase